VSGTATTFEVSKAVHKNNYDHPLQIGYKLSGKVDEVKLFMTDLTADEVMQTMYCPGFQDFPVAAYFSFNEKFVTQVRGFGTSMCTPDSTEAFEGSCLVGTLEGATLIDETPITKPVVEMLSETRSIFDASYEGALVYTSGTVGGIARVHAVDTCGYSFVNGVASTNAFTSDVDLIADSFEGPICPAYPRTTVTPMSPAPVPLLEPSTCTTRNFALPYVKGDVYHVKVSSEKAGDYNVTTKVSSTSKTVAVTPAEVVPGAPAKIVLSGASLAVNPEAGVPFAIGMKLMDAAENVVETEHAVKAKFTLVGKPYTAVVDGVSVFFSDVGEYVSEVTFAKPGTYTAVFELVDSVAEVFMEDDTGMKPMNGVVDVTVKSGKWRPLITNMANANMPSTARRFEHSAFMMGSDMYLWGGAAYDKSYLSDLKKLSNADGMTARETNYFMKKVVVSSTVESSDAVTVEVIVNTKELIDSVKMHPMCKDLMFEDPSSGPLYYYIADHTCGSEATRVFVKLPKATIGDMVVNMYYGNAAAVSSPYADASMVLDIYDGFESPEGADALSLDEGCGSAEVPLEHVYSMVSEEAYTGERVLKLTGSGKVAFHANNSLAGSESFKMIAAFWDDGSCKSAAYISPDFTTCGSTGQGKPTLPNDGSAPLDARSTALGTYTLSTEAKYAVSSPWQSTSQDREAGWHLLEVVSSPAGMKAMVDGVMVKESEAAIAFQYISITTGLGVDAAPHPDLKDAVTYWDEVMAYKYHEGVVATVDGAEETVAYVENRDWSDVTVEGEAPPPRYSHSTVVYGDAVYVFGGERSSYAFNDVWKLEISGSTAKWTYITPMTASGTAAGAATVPSPRFDHVAVVVGDDMIVMGGRDRKDIHADMWSFSFKTHEWKMVAASTVMGGRFGHAAAAVDGSVFLAGGYTAAGFSTGFYSCTVDGQCKDLSVGCDEAPGRATLTSLGVEARIGHALVNAGDKQLVLFGGYSAEGVGFSSFYRFDVPDCSWETIEVDGTPLARYEAGVGMMAGNRLFVHGGHVDGGFEDHVFVVPV